ncbi:MAG: hypothetical protein LBM38_01125 [Clostridiales bacterium]|nr:hypothetical protein [Clostridiales bacterium]
MLKFIKEKFTRLAVSTGVMLSMPMTAFAVTMPAIGSANMDSADSVLSLLYKGIQYIGVIFVVFGAVQAGLGFKNDDAEGKAKGMRSVIAGAIVWGIGALVSGVS